MATGESGDGSCEILVWKELKVDAALREQIEVRRTHLFPLVFSEHLNGISAWNAVVVLMFVVNVVLCTTLLFKFLSISSADYAQEVKY